MYGRADARVIDADTLDSKTLLLPYTRLLVHTKDQDLSVAMRLRQRRGHRFRGGLLVASLMVSRGGDSEVATCPLGQS